MARQSLREFQAQLAERLRSAAQGAPGASKLGFMAGGSHWLADLTEIDEVVTVSQPTPVPWTQPWFLGMVNLRGRLYGCTDLAAFLGLEQATARNEYRLLTAAPRLADHVALCIDQTLGLRALAHMTPLPDSPHSAAWSKARWRDTEGVEWTELDLGQLVNSAAFLDVRALPASGQARSSAHGVGLAGIEADTVAHDFAIRTSTGA